MSEKRNMTLFVVEDDASIRFGLEEVLSAEGFEVVSCEDGNEALPGIAETLPDLILLDVMLPGKSGYEICRELRSRGCRVPILMLTAKGQEMDKVVGLNSGADDYVTKPFGLNELIARVNALLRRTRQWQDGLLEDGPANGELSVGEAIIDVSNYEVTLGGETTPLTPREMELLLFLHQNRGKVLTRDRILEEVWGVQYWGTTRTLDQCVAQVRKKIGDRGRTPSHLLTVHGVGYKLVGEGEG
ncbi:MAG: response regulator transcription factor [Verrucomicrobiota bacterium]